MKTTIRIEPLDPILNRDGRPFDTTPGATARSLDFIAPSAVAGTVRTMVGKYLSSSTVVDDSFNSESVVKAMARATIRGPLYELNGMIYYPFPQDLDLYEVDKKIIVSYRRPLAPPRACMGFLGTDRDGRYEQDLWPVAEASAQKGWKNRPAFVSAEWMHNWLLEKLTPEDWSAALTEWWENQGAGKPASQPAHFLASFARETRVHTSIDDELGVAKDKHLFDTEMLVLLDGMTLLTEINIGDQAEHWPDEPMSTLHTFGGKRRLAHSSEVKNSAVWDVPDVILKDIRPHNEPDKSNKSDHADKITHVRLVLATPAFFAKGWLPRWVDTDTLEADFPKYGVRLKLRWACIPRWQPVSGWSYSKRQEKAVRRMVSAGSVYFFEVQGDGDPAPLMEELWLTSVSDPNRRKGAFDQEDGFGLALWGTWEPASLMKRGMKNEQ
ncbi:type III-B CRISPR module-associated protein Cmr3 [Paenibacillus sp. NPDC057934]|uniref:type III-B CRISPR module-associated protein Cmr3 n=1 Tax=Paenibacillus sp. NPDC057934 TaxID=3346282 RepID=UPI0036DDBAD6